MTKYIWICKQSWVYEGKTWWKREEVEHVPCTPVLWLFYLNGRAGIYMYLQQKKPHQALQMECLPFVFEKTWQTKSSKSYCNIFAMNHWCFKSDCGQNLWKIIFVLQHFFRPKTWWTNKLLNLIAIVWTWPTECFWSDCGQNLWIEIFVLQHFSDQHMVKKHF